MQATAAMLECPVVGMDATTQGSLQLSGQPACSAHAMETVLIDASCTDSSHEELYRCKGQIMVLKMKPPGDAMH